MPNADLDPKRKLVAIYNKDRADAGLQPISYDDYNFSNPTPYSGVKSANNTRVYLTPKSTSAAFGRITVYYNRINLATITGQKVVKGAATTVTQLLPEINEELGVELTSLDIEEAPLGIASTFTLTASPNSYIFTGSTIIGYYI